MFCVASFVASRAEVLCSGSLFSDLVVASFPISRVIPLKSVFCGSVHSESVKIFFRMKHYGLKALSTSVSPCLTMFYKGDNTPMSSQ